MGGIVYGRERKREREDGGEGGKEEGRERILTGEALGWVRRSWNRHEKSTRFGQVEK